MTPADRPAFLEIVIGFAELRGKQLSAGALELFWRAMQGWTIHDFRKAADHLVRTCQFMPSPKDFEDLRKAEWPTAAEAWDRARRACGTAIMCGQVTGNGTCGDDLIDRAVRGIGGYAAIAMCETSKLPFLERRFAEHYEELRDVEGTRRALPGIVAEERKRLSRS